jgi:hypothetical protein
MKATGAISLSFCSMSNEEAEWLHHHALVTAFSLACDATCFSFSRPARQGPAGETGGWPGMGWGNLMTTITENHASKLAIPAPRTILNLAIGGVLGLVIWEIWARVITKAVVGYPLEPAGLIDAIAQHQLGLAVPYLLREALHYAVGIFGYPIAYFIVSRALKNWSAILDVVVFVTFTAAAIYFAAMGKASLGTLAFWIAVTAFIATRFINPNIRLRDSLAWGSFTWFNALGLMAPIGGLSFYVLQDSPELSFMSFVGHVIYGAIAAWFFEWREEKAA